MNLQKIHNFEGFEVKKRRRKGAAKREDEDKSAEEKKRMNAIGEMYIEQ